MWIEFPIAPFHRFACAVGIFVGRHARIPPDYCDRAGSAQLGNCFSRLLVRKSTDRKGKRQRDFADLCLTTWLRRRENRIFATRGNNGGNNGAVAGWRWLMPDSRKRLKQHRPALVSAGRCRLRSRRSRVPIAAGACSHEEQCRE